VEIGFDRRRDKYIGEQYKEMEKEGEKSRVAGKFGRLGESVRVRSRWREMGRKGECERKRERRISSVVERKRRREGGLVLGEKQRGREGGEEEGERERAGER
jgi:hypothetical protein